MNPFHWYGKENRDWSYAIIPWHTGRLCSNVEGALESYCCPFHMKVNWSCDSVARDILKKNLLNSAWHGTLLGPWPRSLRWWPCCVPSHRRQYYLLQLLVVHYHLPCVIQLLHWPWWPVESITERAYNTHSVQFLYGFSYFLMPLKQLISFRGYYSSWGW